MLNRIQLTFFIGLVFFLSACEEVIELPLKSTESILVIEGSVSNLEAQQTVLLSEMQPFYSQSRNKPVSGAKISLNENNGIWYQLKEIEEGRYVINDFTGTPGHTYGLTVNYEGRTYKAEAQMPELVRIDSIGISTNSFGSSRKTPIVSYQDPPGIQNYYYYQLSINDKIRPTLFVYNDKFNDGKTVIQEFYESSLDLAQGDNIIIELRNIDKASYNYWKSIQSQTGTSSSPANPSSNLTNGALGYFSVYSANKVFFKVE